MHGDIHIHTNNNALSLHLHSTVCTQIIHMGSYCALIPLILCSALIMLAVGNERYDNLLSFGVQPFATTKYKSTQATQPL